ncbi:MAG: phosphate signaling complex protein PhoU [candidate division WOR-3 bacterium]|nr:phosphate signaling complex protein PhoU [candidate division WOR-3 bacterium]
MTALEGKIAELKQQLFTMAGIVEEMVANSVKALVNKDPALAEQVIGTDEDRVNHLEIENEDAAINLMALYQPEASNLRTIVMVIKVNNDLERLGDHAVNIAEAAQFLIERPAVKPLTDIPKMADHAIAMLKDSLDAFTRSDAELARAVCGRDSIVDDLNDTVKRDLAKIISVDPTTSDRALKLMMVSLNLERIADLATNISEDVIYIATGQSIKHGRGKPQDAEH